MVDAWRVTIKGKESEDREAFKELHFKQLYNSSGDSVTFELPANDEAAADALVKEAEAAGFTAEKEAAEDPLGDAGSVDFW